MHPVHPSCYRTIEISVHNVELAPNKQLQVNDIFMKSIFGKFYRLEFHIEFFSLFHSDILVMPDGSRPNCWQVHGWLTD